MLHVAHVAQHAHHQLLVYTVDTVVVSAVMVHYQLAWKFQSRKPSPIFSSPPNGSLLVIRSPFPFPCSTHIHVSIFWTQQEDWLHRLHGILYQSLLVLSWSWHTHPLQYLKQAMHTIERCSITYVWQSQHLHKCTHTKLGRSSSKVLHSWWGFHQHMRLWNRTSKELTSRVVMSGRKQLFHTLCLLLQVVVLGSGLTLVYMNHTGPHLRNHQRHAMSWSLLRLQEGMSYPLQVHKSWTEMHCTSPMQRGMSSKLTDRIWIIYILA